MRLASKGLKHLYNKRGLSKTKQNYYNGYTKHLPITQCECTDAMQSAGKAGSCDFMVNTLLQPTRHKQNVVNTRKKSTRVHVG